MRNARMAIVGAVAVVAVAAVYARSGPQTFAECMLSEMKGQPTTVTYAAYQVCLAKFPQQQQLTADEMQAKAEALLKEGKNPFEAFSEQGVEPPLWVRIKRFFGVYS